MLWSARPAPDQWFGDLFINPVNPHVPTSGVKIGFFESTGQNPYQYESINAGFAAGERFLQIPRNERRRMMFDAGLIELHRRYQEMQDRNKEDLEQERMSDERYGISQWDLERRDENDKLRKKMAAWFAAEFGKWP